jgi:hypothetical protein
MSSLWDSLRDVVVDTGSRLGNAAGRGALIAKLKADLLLLDRELLARKQRFGVEMYDYVAPLSKSQSFYTSDDTLTLTLQPPLIKAQREIAALEIKRTKQQEKIQEAAQVRASAFRPAENWTDVLVNAGKSAALGGNEAKLSTELALYNRQVQHFKQEFGVSLYNTLEELEDSKQWLPTDREIRSIYDNCRRDVEKIQKKKSAKEAEIKTAQNGGVEEYDGPQVSSERPEFSIQTQGAQPSLYAKDEKKEELPTNYYGATANVNTTYPATDKQPSMYLVVPPQQNHFQPPQAPVPSQPQHYQSPQMVQQPQIPPQQPAPVLHSNLFAGVVPGTAPIPQQQQQQQGHDPFDAFADIMAQPQQQPQQQQWQQQHPQQQQQQPQHDPFANNTQPFPFGAQPAAPAAGASSDGYIDPFSGL